MKKRGQSKKAIIDMINLSMEKSETIDRREKFQILDTIRNLTEGKLFLEVINSYNIG
jgi:26S proteasome regulatory subunit N5